jgi:hypothetical protein
MVVQVKRIADQLRLIAGQLDRLAERPGGDRSHRELTQIANRFERIGNALEKSSLSGRVNAQQITSIAANLEGIGAALRKSVED